MWDSNLVDWFHRGGPLMWPLLATSVIGLALILERAAVFYRLLSSYAAFLRSLESLLTQQPVARVREILSRQDLPHARVALAFLEQIGKDRGRRQESMAAIASEQLARLELRLHWIATVAQVAPILGLLGTVTGLVECFHQIEISGQAQPSELANGIWEALLTTVFGLVIAVPALLAHHAFDARAGQFALECSWLHEALETWLERSQKPAEIPINTTEYPENDLDRA